MGCGNCLGTKLIIIAYSSSNSQSPKQLIPRSSTLAVNGMVCSLSPRQSIFLKYLIYPQLGAGEATCDKM